MVEHPDNNDTQRNSAVDSFVDHDAEIAAKVAALTQQLHPILQQKLSQARGELNQQSPTGGRHSQGPDTPALA